MQYNVIRQAQKCGGAVAYNGAHTRGSAGLAEDEPEWGGIPRSRERSRAGGCERDSIYVL